MMQRGSKVLLLNSMYRSLLRNGRTYASFNEKEVTPLVEYLFARGATEIFDPMSGYGTIVHMCEKYSIGTYCVEINAPSYLWQVLNNPNNANLYLKAVDILLCKPISPPNGLERSEISDDWYTDRGKEVILDLYRTIRYSFTQIADDNEATILSLALLIPFVSRLSCSLNGDVAHVKKGGLCVYSNYIEDFKLYLTEYIHTRLTNNAHLNSSVMHTSVLGDCSEVELRTGKFHFMITSPPYPNTRDYIKMFAPENYILDWLYQINESPIQTRGPLSIGTNVVSGRTTGEIISPSANEFLYALGKYKGTTKSIRDNIGYYAPYYKNYFYDIQKAYTDIAPSLSSTFEGFIIVSNNTAKNLVVPVDKMIIELWEYLGFEAAIYNATEKSHFGAKNPDTKGFKARHMEYVIRVWRNVSR